MRARLARAKPWKIVGQGNEVGVARIILYVASKLRLKYGREIGINEPLMKFYNLTELPCMTPLICRLGRHGSPQ